ncbi:MAG: FtsW/RodA/SpoVE family cell cycle protein [Candidatus Colwellbacteria bacterium]|nr:FtsW/RodA/SpoVE family cell cycle protein [Candidatus Colwellbacteria bacterium]
MNFIRNYDIWLLVSFLLLLSIGLVNLLSLNIELFQKQLISAAIAFFIVLTLPIFNLKAILSYRWVIFGVYFIALLLLISAYFFAPEIAGTKRWFAVGDFRLQPSEFMKIALILLFAKFFASRHVAIKRPSIIVISLIYLLPAVIFTALGPDMGTALMILGIWAGFLLTSEIPAKFVLIMLVAFFILGIFMWNFGLADYQKDRVMALLNPEIDPLGISYNVIQSKIAIGSAGFFGKGFGQGTQAQLGFLPNAATDFPFAAFVEEWGIFGAFILVSLFVFFIFRILKIGMASDNNFFKFISIGTSVMLLIHFIVNIGSNLGLLPVTGITLPLISFGGSSLLTVAILTGIILHTAKRRAGY